MDRIKISFIQTSYNEKDFIRECIESILSINIKCPYEIIIVDDGSDDGSIDIIKEYAAKYSDIIKYYVMERRGVINKYNTILAKRLSNVLKKGFELAKSEYIININSDDYYVNKNFVDKAIKFLDNNKKYSALSYGSKLINNKNVNEIYDYPNQLYWATKYNTSCNYIVRNDERFKKSLMPNFCDDTSLTYSIITYGKIAFCNEIIHHYRENENSIMHTTNEIEHLLLDMIIFHEMINYKRKCLISTYKRFWWVFQSLDKYKDCLDDPQYALYIKEINKYNINLFKKYFYGNTFDKFIMKSIAKLTTIIFLIIYKKWLKYDHE